MCARPHAPSAQLLNGLSIQYENNRNTLSKQSNKYELFKQIQFVFVITPRAGGGITLRASDKMQTKLPAMWRHLSYKIFEEQAM